MLTRPRGPAQYDVHTLVRTTPERAMGKSTLSGE